MTEICENCRTLFEELLKHIEDLERKNAGLERRLAVYENAYSHYSRRIFKPRPKLPNGTRGRLKGHKVSTRPVSKPDRAIKTKFDKCQIFLKLPREHKNMNDIYASWHAAQRKKYAAIQERINFVSLFQGKRVLDIGAGPGYFRTFLHKQGIKSEIISIDPEKSYMEKVDVVAKAEQLPFRDEVFDTIVCIDALHLIKGKEFLSTLKQGGHLLCSLFFRDDNFIEKRKLLHSLCEGFEVVKEFSLPGKEKEHVILARKQLSHLLK